MTERRSLDTASLRAVLARLSDEDERSDGTGPFELDGWCVTRLLGGRNNLLYRLSGPMGDVVAKFTIRDGRDRAGREYDALTVLADAGISIAPRPVLLDRQSCRQPLVVQEWLAGEPLRRPPQTDGAWERLAELLALCHRVRPGQESVLMRPAVQNAATAEAALQIVRDELARMPAAERPAQVDRIAERLERERWPAWPEPQLTMVRCDPNIANVISRSGTWGCVDWEYSGWGDPAYDVAEFTMHPSCVSVPQARWTWFCERVLAGDPWAWERIAAYRKTMTAWWLARLTRLRYETLRGLDRRLAQPDPDWEAEIERNFQHYLHVAEGI